MWLAPVWTSRPALSLWVDLPPPKDTPTLTHSAAKSLPSAEAPLHLPSLLAATDSVRVMPSTPHTGVKTRPSAWPVGLGHLSRFTAILSSVLPGIYDPKCPCPMVVSLLTTLLSHPVICLGSAWTILSRAGIRCAAHPVPSLPPGKTSLSSWAGNLLLSICSSSTEPTVLTAGRPRKATQHPAVGFCSEQEGHFLSSDTAAGLRSV